ncbi:MAG: hypothetical protein J7L51_04000 [Desulfurococcales archaeon]|nr:hypothetical protein [Desulfurococcales archaeon]
MTQEECKKQLESELSLYMLSHLEVDWKQAFTQLIQDLCEEANRVFHQAPDTSFFCGFDLNEYWHLREATVKKELYLCHRSRFDPELIYCQSLSRPIAKDDFVRELITELEPRDACTQLQVIRKLQEFIHMFRTRGDT